MPPIAFTQQVHERLGEHWVVLVLKLLGLELIDSLAIGLTISFVSRVPSVQTAPRSVVHAR